MCVHTNVLLIIAVEHLVDPIVHTHTHIPGSDLLFDMPFTTNIFLYSLPAQSHLKSLPKYHLFLEGMLRYSMST